MAEIVFKKDWKLKRVGMSISVMGICTDCPNIYLDVDNDDYQDGFGNIIHCPEVHCIHEEACERVMDIFCRKEEKGDDLE